MSSQLETNLVSVERVNEYSNIPTEVRIYVKVNVKVIIRLAWNYHIASNINVNCKYKCIRNWPLPNGAFQDQYKQIVINKHN